MLSELDRQLWAGWRAARGRGAATGPTVAVLGNCQTLGVAYALQMLNPAAVVDRYQITRKGLATLDHAVGVFKRYDYVFSTEFPSGYLRGGGGFADLRAALPGVFSVPSLVFSAYHPDLIYILDSTRNGRPVAGPLADYHSALALYGFLRGYDLARTQALFADAVYRAAGYYDTWPAAAAALLHLGAASGLDLTEDFLRWSRAEPFMYSINHPKPFVLADLAAALARKAALPIRAAPFHLYGVDETVRDAVFPVYPEIAARYGQHGAYLFKARNHKLHRTLGAFYDLPAFLRASFAVYRALDRAQLVAPRTQGWLDSQETRRLFDDLTEEGRAGRARAAL